MRRNETDLLLPRPAPGDEWHHHTLHTHYFGFSVPEAAIGAYIYVRYFPALNISQGGVCIFEGFDNLAPTDSAHLNYEMAMPWPEISGNVITTANGLKVDFIEPGKTVRLSYDSGDGDCSFVVDQMSVTPLIPRGHAMPGEELHHTPSSRDPGGSEQFMHCTGTLELHGKHYDVDCLAPRDRTWSQVRAEARGAVTMPPMGWSPMCFGDDLALNLIGYESLDTNPAWKGVIDIPADAPTFHYSWIFVDGEVRNIASARRDVIAYHPEFYIAQSQRIDIVDDTGAEYSFEGEAIAIANLPPIPMLSFHDSVYRWTDDRGRVTYASYQEMWFDRYQLEMKKRRRAAQPK